MGNITVPNKRDVHKFLESVENDIRRRDATTLLDLIRKRLSMEAVMWGDSIIGFGDYTYTSPSGRTIKWFNIGFSPRKKYLTIYVPFYIETKLELVKELGDVKFGKGCIYIKKLTDINQLALTKLIDETKKGV